LLIQAKEKVTAGPPDDCSAEHLLDCSRIKPGVKNTNNSINHAFGEEFDGIKHAVEIKTRLKAYEKRCYVRASIA
jgi:hypothetical protein